MTNTKSLRSKAMTLAHKLKSDTLSFGAAITKAWKVIKLKKKMTESDEPVIFSYYAKSKSKFIKGDYIRPAIGTLNTSLFDYTPKKNTSGKERKQNPTQIKYYDLERKAWRSFSAAKLAAAIL